MFLVCSAHCRQWDQSPEPERQRTNPAVDPADKTALYMYFHMTPAHTAHAATFPHSESPGYDPSLVDRVRTALLSCSPPVLVRVVQAALGSPGPASVSAPSSVTVGFAGASTGIGPAPGVHSDGPGYYVDVVNPALFLGLWSDEIITDYVASVCHWALLDEPREDQPALLPEVIGLLRLRGQPLVSTVTTGSHIPPHPEPEHPGTHTVLPGMLPVMTWSHWNLCFIAS